MRNILIILFSLCILGSKAQNLYESPVKNGARLTFDKSEADFGSIPEKGGKVSHNFGFVNKGKTPLVITKVITSCSCTKAEFPKKPVQPGERGSITVTFDPNKQVGVFYKAIQVFSNGEDKRLIVVIKGKVVAN